MKVKLTFEEFTALMIGLMCNEGCGGNLMPSCDDAELTLNLITEKWGVWDYGQLECWYRGIETWFDFNHHISRRGAVGKDINRLQKKLGKLLPKKVLNKYKAKITK